MTARSTPKRVVVTGASAGVGRATALAFARNGCAVGLIARGRERLEGAARDVEAAGGRPLILPLDVADAGAVEAAAEEAERTWGGIDVWVNCAMATVFSPAVEMGPEEFERVTRVTYLGYVHGTLAALRRMRPAGRGTIVQVGSALAYRSIPLQSAYCAAKAAIRAFTDSLRSELIHEGSAVRLSMVHLPAVNTPQFDWARSRLPRRPQPVPPIHQPEAVAPAILRAALEAPRELWVGGATVKAIVGQMAVPAWLDRKLAQDAWDGQMTDAPPREDRPDNLFAPATGDWSAQGRFASRARRSATAVDAARLRLGAALIAGGLAASILATVGAMAARRRALR